MHVQKFKRADVCFKQGRYHAWSMLRQQIVTQICQLGKLNEMILDVTSKCPTCCVSNHSWFLGMVQNCRTCTSFSGIVSSVVAIIKSSNREICCRLRIFILFSIAKLKMRLRRLFRCSLKEESRRIKNMRKKRKVCFSSSSIIFVINRMLRFSILNDMFIYF